MSDSSLPITQVTLMEDRARVVRRGVVTLDGAITTITLVGIAPTLVDRTLVAEVNGMDVSAARISRRKKVAAVDKPEEAARIDAELLHNRRKQEQMRLRAVAGAHELEALDNMQAMHLSEFAQDCSWKSMDSAALDHGLGEISEAARAARHQQVHLEEELRMLLDEQAALQSLAAQQHVQTALNYAELAVDVFRPEGNTIGTCTLQLSYVVANACWRPFHRAEAIRASGIVFDPQALQFTSYAAIWQNTGEDWTGVELLLSTERMSLGETAPQLHPDWLRTQTASPAVDIAYREEEVARLAPEPRFHAGGPKRLALAGIGEGGVALTLRASHAVSVTANGKPHTVQLASFAMDCRSIARTMPELVREPLLTTHQTNTSSQAILAGPVHLVRHGGASGVSEVEFVAAGEPFDLGWGPMPGVRVSRRVENVAVPAKLLSGWRGEEHRIEIRVTNLTRDPQTLELQERIPVSEIDKVKLVTHDVTQNVVPDSDGFLRWTVSLGPLDSQTILYRYILSQHPSTYSADNQVLMMS